MAEREREAGVLTPEQQDDIDSVIWGKVDNSHDAGGPDMSGSECAGATIYDCVHYFTGVVEDACCGDPDKEAHWPAGDLDELKLQVVDYIRGKYFGPSSDTLAPR